jgi:hypothetical protein
LQITPENNMEYLIFEDSARGGPYPTEDKILAHCESKRYTPLDKPNIDAVSTRSLASLATIPPHTSYT